MKKLIGLAVLVVVAILAVVFMRKRAKKETIVEPAQPAAPVAEVPKPKQLDLFSNPDRVSMDWEMPVVGVTFEGRQPIIRALIGNEKLVLIAEQMNGYPNAIGVYANGKKIGYVSDHGLSIAAKLRPYVLADKMSVVS
jgi:hypothetical protein